MLFWESNIASQYNLKPIFAKFWQEARVRNESIITNSSGEAKYSNITNAVNTEHLKYYCDFTPFAYINQINISFFINTFQFCFLERRGMFFE